MQVLTSKITVPKIPCAFVKRQRLTDRLKGSDHGCSVLLTAPAGYGKTTLAVQFLEEQPQNMKAWYTLESHDISPQLFATYLTESLARPVPRLRASGLLESLAGGRFDSVGFIDDLSYFFEEYSGPQVWCVLDNWEAVNDSAEICSMIERLINYAQVKLRLIVAGRVNPGFRSRKMQETGRLLMFQEDDLRFSRTELAEAIRLRSNISLNDKETEKVYGITRGWCVSIGFIRESLKRGDTPDGLAVIKGLKGTDALREYLEQEVTRGLPEDVRTFLCHCSLLDTVSVESCSAFEDDRKVAGAKIRQLQDCSLPLLSIGENEFRLHPLLKEASYEMLKVGGDEETFASLHEGVSNYYLGQGNLSKAIELLFAIANYDRILELIHEHWFRFLALGKLTAIENWLARIPKDRQTEPHYLEAKTRLLSLLGHYKELEDFLAHQLKTATLPAGSPALGTMWLQHRGSLLLTQKGYLYEDLLRDWKEFRKGSGPFDESVLVGAEEILGYAAYAELKIREAAMHLRQAIKLIPDNTHPNALRLRTFLALQDSEAGKAGIAQEKLEEILVESRRAGVHATIPVTLTFLIRVLSRAGDFETAQNYIDQLEDAVRQSRTASDMIGVHADRYRGCCSLYTGDVRAGIAHLKESMQRARDNYLLEFANSARIYEYYSYLLGREVRILPPEESDPNSPLSEESLHYRLHAIYRKTCETDLRAAYDSIRELSVAVKEHGLKPWLVTCNFLASWIERKQGLIAECKKSLRKGLGLLREIDWRHYPLANSQVTAHVISAAHGWNIAPEQALVLRDFTSSLDLGSQVQELLSLEDVTPNGKLTLINLALSQNLRSVTSISSLAVPGNNRRLREAQREYEKKRASMPLPPLNVHTFGGFITVCQGRQIEFARPQSRLLLAWLFAAHPKPVHEELIIESLWPKTGPERARANLRTVVSALRKSLDPGFQHPGKSYVVLDAEQYSLDLPEDRHVDFIEFERLCDGIADGGEPRTDLSVSELRSMEAALNLYQGDFLGQFPYEDFASMRREDLRARYFKVLEFYCERLLEFEELEKAESAIRAGLRHDPYWAAGVALAVEVYARGNQTLKALKIYRKYEADLRANFDLKPSRELQDRFEQLLVS